MRLLVFTTLFPWPAVPHHGIFVWERLRAYLRRHGAEAVVIAPVPAVPKALARGEYAVYRDVPDEEERDGVRILHPRYPLIPKLSMNVAPMSLAWAGERAFKRLAREGERFDLIDAHYLYPDSVAAARIAVKHDLPLVVTARGTDVSLLPNYPVPARWLRWMLKRADAGIAVCDALRIAMEPLHGGALDVTTLGNGVDLDKFRRVPVADARASLGWSDGPIVLSVGHLIDRKGHHHLIDAVPHLPDDVQVKVVGQGPREAALRSQIDRLGVGDRVELCGAMPHETLHRAYAAADVLTLLSSREGWPNVVLESLACGTPVVATRIWGTPEILRDPRIGTLVDEPTPEAVASAVKARLAHEDVRAEARAYAEQHSWDRVADGMDRIFRRITARSE